MIQWIKDKLRGIPMGAIGHRSPQWPAVRKAFLKLHPTCEVCGTKGSLLKPNELHHKLPVHLDIERKFELDFSNLITLCRNHHLLFGHLMSFRRGYNLSVVEDANLWKTKIQKVR